MKLLILIGVWVLASPSLFAQAYQYHPFDTSSRWVMGNVYSAAMPPSYTKVYGQFISEDTIINNQTYKKVEQYAAWHSSTGIINSGGQIGTSYHNDLGDPSFVIGAIREDSLQRVYYYDFGTSNQMPYIYNWPFPLEEEVLLYDFGMTVGDSILRYVETHLNPLDSFYMHVVAIDSVQLSDGTYRKRFDLRGVTNMSSQTPTDTVAYLWVEGIGVFNGIPFSIMDFYPTSMFGWYCNMEGLLGGWTLIPSGHLWGWHSEVQLLCFFDDSTKLVGDTNSFCDTVPPHLLAVSKAKAVVDTKIELYPNPFQTEASLMVYNVDCVILSVHVFNATGQWIQKTSSSNKEIKLERKNLNTGIYFYKVWADERAIGSGTFVIN